MISEERKTRVLFVCSQNRRQSPTAERVFSQHPRLEVRSAGVAADSTKPINDELLDWADMVFVMDRRQRSQIYAQFGDIYRLKRIICLYIPEEYDFMEPELIRLLSDRVSQHLPLNTEEMSREEKKFIYKFGANDSQNYL